MYKVEAAHPKPAKNTNHVGSIFRRYHGQTIRFARYEKGPRVGGGVKSHADLHMGAKAKKNREMAVGRGNYWRVYISKKMDFEEFD